MEKLLKLLREYDDYSYYWGIEFWKIVWDVSWTDHILYTRESDAIIKSKEYWFIERLVEQDKINEKKVFHFLDNSKLYEDLLCNLALSDEPIEELITYLK